MRPDLATRAGAGEREAGGPADGMTPPPEAAGGQASICA